MSSLMFVIMTLTSVAVTAPIVVQSHNILPKSFIYSIPEVGEEVIFNCTTSAGTTALFWILPNGTRVDVGEGTEDHRTDVIVAVNLNVSISQLIIPQVHQGMDGQYVCVLENAQRQIFFIPYVVSAINFKQAVMISLGVTVGFAIACALVLIFDRYCASGFQLMHRSAQVAHESPLPARKQRIMSSKVTEDGSDMVIESDGEQLAMQSRASHH